MDNPTTILDDNAGPPEPSQESSLRILIANEQSLVTVCEEQLLAVVRRILVDVGYQSAMISIAVVDDPTIQALNRQYLQHDWPTDVLSFPLENDHGNLEGEVIVSAETAERCADQIGWPAKDELLLYIVHGMLHLVGYHDKQPDEIAAMRSAEMKYLQQAGVAMPASDERWHRIDGELAPSQPSTPNPQPPTHPS